MSRSLAWPLVVFAVLGPSALAGCSGDGFTPSPEVCPPLPLRGAAGSGSAGYGEIVGGERVYSQEELTNFQNGCVTPPKNAPQPTP